MTHITEAFDVAWLQALVGHVDRGNVTGRKHPDLPITIYNYTPQCAYNREWDDVTMNCRGLILDRDGNIVARPFPKFFNLGEWGELTLPDSFPDRVYDKMDGSLGIVYEYDGHVGVATRGSFVSEQALWATEWLLQTHPEWMPTEGVTDLFEIIYPGNRIVVNYGDRREMVHLARIDNATGADLQPYHSGWKGDYAKLFATRELDDLVNFANERDNAEGFVCVWQRKDGPSLRIKIKSEEYIAMHRVVTGLSNRIVWEHLGAGTIDQLRDQVPDELYEWFDEQVELLQSEFETIYLVASEDLQEALRRAGSAADRARIAQYVKKTAWPGLCFGLLDKKDIGPMIWKMIRPTRETPVLTVQEDA